MDRHLSYQVSVVRTAELHREAARQRLAQPALAEKDRRSSLRRLLQRASRDRKPVEAPVPVKAAPSLAKPH
jgi:hypothetical protein